MHHSHLNHRATDLLNGYKETTRVPVQIQTGHG